MKNGQWWDCPYNPITGCSPVSPGCAHCWAERMAQRLRGRCGYPADDPFRPTFHPERLLQPFRWNKPRRVFVCDMGDLFHPDISSADINRVIDFMVNPMRGGNHHTYLLLTKRPGRILQGHIDHFREWPNIWLGVSVENQSCAEARIPVLLRIPAAVRFACLEPLLGPVDLRPWIKQLDWVIVGGETGPGARPMHPDWVRKVRDQCQEAGVPFWLKQMGKDRSRILDGRTWEERPK